MDGELGVMVRCTGKLRLHRSLLRIRRRKLTVEIGDLGDQPISLIYKRLPRLRELLNLGLALLQLLLCLADDNVQWNLLLLLVLEALELVINVLDELMLMPSGDREKNLQGFPGIAEGLEVVGLAVVVNEGIIRLRLVARLAGICSVADTSGGRCGRVHRREHQTGNRCTNWQPPRFGAVMALLLREESRTATTAITVPPLRGCREPSSP